MINVDTFIDLQVKVSVLCGIYLIIHPMFKKYSASFRYRIVCISGYMVLVLGLVHVTDLNIPITVATDLPLSTDIVDHPTIPHDHIGEEHAIEDITSFVDYLLYFYWFCAGIFLFRFLNQLRFSNRIKRSAEIVEYFYKIPVLVTHTEQSPFTIGVFNPVIILPKSSIGWSVARKENILNHEFAHILSYDFVSNVIFQMLKAVFFINPFYHAFFKELVLLRELSCDEYVMERSTKASEYATDIIEIARCMVNSNQESFMISFTSKGHIEKRIKSLFEYNKSPRKGSSYIMVIVLSLIVSSQLFAFKVVCEPISENNDTVKINTSNDIVFIKPLDQIKYLITYKETVVNEKSRKTKTHSGVDLAGAEGAKVYATADGKVNYSGSKGNYGLYIQVEHEKNYSTHFAHLSKVLVKKGDHVRAGDVIGLVGSTGKSTGAHLHYEIRKNGKAINPIEHMK